MRPLWADCVAPSIRTRLKLLLLPPPVGLPPEPPFPANAAGATAKATARARIGAAWAMRRLIGGCSFLLTAVAPKCGFQLGANSWSRWSDLRNLRNVAARPRRWGQNSHRRRRRAR